VGQISSFQERLSERVTPKCVVIRSKEKRPSLDGFRVHSFSGSSEIILGHHSWLLLTWGFACGAFLKTDQTDGDAICSTDQLSASSFFSSFWKN